MATSTRTILALFFVALWGGMADAQVPPGKVGTKPAPPTPGKEVDEELRRLLKARHDEAVAEFNELAMLTRDVKFGTASLVDASRRLVQSGLELHGEPKDRVAFLTDHVDSLKAIEKSMEGRIRGGVGLQSDIHRVRYYRLDAEIQLLRAQREVDKAKAK